MVVTFVSNYINHHQIPVCNALQKEVGEGSFYFIQTSPMEKKRVEMGWAVDPKSFGYVVVYYENKEKCEKLISDSDVVIFGWSDGLIEDLEKRRLSSGKLSFRLSERIYREGQWKAVTPKGLIKKYHEHFVYRNKPVYLLCAGAYVASDFDLIHCYPQKKLKWGYYPDRDYENVDKEPLSGRKVKLCWAGRLIRLKHPEYAVKAAEILRDKGYEFTLEIIGDGNQKDYIENLIAEKGLKEYVALRGQMNPAEVLEHMKISDIFLFTSNYLEGWGAVVNEAMGCGCAVVASKEAGAVPFLIKDGYNGYSYENGNFDDFVQKVLQLFETKELITDFGVRAFRTIRELWNAGNAAKEFTRFCGEFIEGRVPAPSIQGPMSVAQNIKPAGFWRTMQEENHLE
ncbi:MAG: glycosyltransferase [Butyrivibrio sp.]|uniref:glycosyltransferase n=1 Tax=Butyrivibrio sp. TaxID=28121 RepID=UPI001B147189|nr:glycosyltransferase [Butyrivibrio sp.]MBO6241602.1 glycosyltransferase [Butyrivibrio sp.]